MIRNISPNRQIPSIFIFMIQEQKQTLRRHVKDLKKKVALSDKIILSSLIFEKVEQHNSFKNANVVLLYWSMEDEVATHDFVKKWEAKKTILLPVVDGSLLKIKQFKGMTSMRKGAQFGIMEPDGEEYKNLDAIDLIIVPGIAFDSGNNRMGRGRGFYDKLLTTTKATKMGVCFNFQFFESIPVEKHDLPMDIVIKA